METLNLKEVATTLQMTPEGLRAKLARGEIPAAKVGRRWVILLSDRHPRPQLATYAATKAPVKSLANPFEQQMQNMAFVFAILLQQKS